MLTLTSSPPLWSGGPDENEDSASPHGRIQPTASTRRLMPAAICSEMDSKAMKTSDYRLVPYEQVEPGFEAVYIGETFELGSISQDLPGNVFVDKDGRAARRWSTYAAWFSEKPEDWDDDVRMLNVLQERLGWIDDETRRVRAHIGTVETCDAGLPVVVDEILTAIEHGRFLDRPFRAGCRCGDEPWELCGTQPRQVESMRAIRDMIERYRSGESPDALARACPHAEGFVRRTCQWLGPSRDLTALQQLLLDRMLLPFEFFSQWSHTIPPCEWPAGQREEADAIYRNGFEEGGRGKELDRQIAAHAGLPPIHEDYRREFWSALDGITDPGKRDLYRLCGAMAHGVPNVCDCHHATFRKIERYVHAIGTGRWDIPGRQAGVERQRIGRLLCGYALGLDKWLLEKPMQFLLLDLGHIDLGFDPKNEIVRVYAQLGDKSPTKEWLAGCLWHCLYTNGRGKHTEFEALKGVGIGVREWMDALVSIGGEGTRQAAPLR